MWVAAGYVILLAILAASSWSAGYLWCRLSEDRARADADFWRRVARAWRDEETPCECEDCLDGDPVAIREHALHQLGLADTGLCQTCGLEPYDPDCGCVCDCHHRCERVEASRG